MGLRPKRSLNLPMAGSSRAIVMIALELENSASLADSPPSRTT